MLGRIAAAWKKAKCPVLFSGAGMSTESGLPDFRSARGLWKQQPESLATPEAMFGQPDAFYFFYQWRIARLWEVAPNLGHLRLAQLEQAGFLQKVITQNVDGLHQRAGSERVVELHGTLRTVSCLSCRAGYDSRQMLPARSDWEADYQEGRYRRGDECRCPRCRGMLRPDVVLFGEGLPEEAWTEAVRWSRQADFFVVVGSSLAVSPANLCPLWAVERGARLLIINAEPTPLDDRADWVIRTPAAEALDRIADEVLISAENPAEASVGP
ncbi:NAD-dependent protein deacylase [Heliobacterium undosum]|uniref:protein acetyllysine N-acetyltransferase n=2 Tax=Heliomicrobium undosum TaxID=121734 RepID=A0A845LDC6_9FIRM|nr:NAD-dependent protein deacylase [Heliomicrobium undosum]